MVRIWQCAGIVLAEQAVAVECDAVVKPVANGARYDVGGAQDTVWPAEAVHHLQKSAAFVVAMVTLGKKHGGDVFAVVTKVLKKVFALW